VIREAWRRVVERGDYSLLDEVRALAREMVAAERARRYGLGRCHDERTKIKIGLASRARAREQRRSKSTGKFLGPSERD